MQHETGQTWLLTAAVHLLRDDHDEAAAALTHAHQCQRSEPMMRQPLALLEAWLAQATAQPNAAHQHLQRAIAIWQQLGLTAWGVPPLLEIIASYPWPQDVGSQLDAWRASFA